MSGREGRRAFLKTGIAGVAGLGRFGRRASGVERAARVAGVAAGRARNVILLVGDGMGLGSVTLGDVYSRVTRKKRLAWLELMNDSRVRTGLSDTSSADGFVADSSATASAWSTGEKINNQAVNIAPDGRELEPLFARAQRVGKATAVVTTSRLTDATPACMYANVPKRSMEREIGEQMLSRGVSIMLGGGGSVLEGLDEGPGAPTRVTDRESLMTHCSTMALPRERLLGAFAPAEIPFVMDREAGMPDLVSMTRAALRALSMHDEGFVLLVEGGRIDHAAHANDAAALVREMVEFDDAIAVCAEYGLGREDTLVIVTSDHANANPGLTKYGRDGDAAFARLVEAKHSFEWMFAEYGRRVQAGAPGGAETIRAVVFEGTGIELTEAQAAMVAGAAEGRRDIDPFRSRSGVSSVLGSVLANHYGVAFISPNHASDFVLVSAMGPGSERLPTFGQNTEVCEVIRAGMGV